MAANRTPGFFSRSTASISAPWRSGRHSIPCAVFRASRRTPALASPHHVEQGLAHGGVVTSGAQHVQGVAPDAGVLVTLHRADQQLLDARIVERAFQRHPPLRIERDAYVTGRRVWRHLADVADA